MILPVLLPVILGGIAQAIDIGLKAKALNDKFNGGGMTPEELAKEWGEIQDDVRASNAKWEASKLEHG